MAAKKKGPEVFDVEHPAKHGLQQRLEMNFGDKILYFMLGIIAGELISMLLFNISVVW